MVKHVCVKLTLHVEARSADDDVDTEAIVRDLRER